DPFSHAHRPTPIPAHASTIRLTRTIACVPVTSVCSLRQHPRASVPARVPGIDSIGEDMPMPLTARLATVIVLAGAMLLAGCASNRPTPDPGALPTGAPPRVAASLKAITKASGPATAASLWLTDAPDRKFTYTLNGETHDVVRRIEKAPDGTVTVAWVDAESGTLRSSQIVVDGADGALVSPQSTNIDRGVISRFRPPLTMLDGSMVAGDPSTQKVEVLVADA